MRRFIYAGFPVAVGWLFRPASAQAADYRQVLAPVAGSLTWSALVAALPLVTLFFLLGGLRWPARWAALAAMCLACLIAALVYGMPPGQVASGAAEGAAIGFFPIIWIGINAIWVYDLTEASGHSHVLRRAFGHLSDDPRILAILVAFCFGALLESLAGGGAPVAICCVMLISLGIGPLQAAAVCLIADTSPVAFGSLGLPITVLSTVTSLPVHSLSLMIGRQKPLLALLVPFILLLIVDGRRGLRQVWPLALAAGLSFAAAQLVGSALLPVELVDITAALFSCAVTIAFLRLWTAARIPVPQPLGAAASEPLGGPGALGSRDSAAATFRSLAPYLLVLLVVVLVQIRPVAAMLDRATSVFHWPGLSVETAAGRPVAAVNAKFEWLLSAGSLVLIAGALSAPVLGISLLNAAHLYALTLQRLRWAIATVCFVVSLAFVMNLSGQTITLGALTQQ
jgi:lactate permease